MNFPFPKLMNLFSPVIYSGFGCHFNVEMHTVSFREFNEFAKKPKNETRIMFIKLLRM